LAHETYWANLHIHTPEMNFAATLFYAITDFLWVLDRSPMYMEKWQIQDSYKAGQLYLKCSMNLADLCLEEKIFRWKFRPKTHYMDHQVDELLQGGWNPRFWQCWMDEDFMGKVALLACKCPKTNTAFRNTSAVNVAVCFALVPGPNLPRPWP